MKKITTVFMLLLAIFTLSAQDITGKWTGILSFQDQMGQDKELRINFNVSVAEDGYISTLDSPDQGGFGIPTDTTIFKNPEITIKVSQLYLEYNGNLEDGTNIKGNITQAGQSLELNLKKEE